MTYIYLIEAQLEEWLISINEFQEELEVEDDDIKLNYQEQLAQIQIKLDVLKDLLVKLRGIPEDHWLETKKVIDLHWQELKTTIEDAPFISIN
jgi:hypothetical protein